MIKWNRFFASVTMAALLLAGCGNQVSAEQASDEPQVETTLPQIDATKWNYNAEDGVYWQVGISYCENPADLAYETLGIFVPEAYMTAEENGDGTYTCTINTNGTAENYTAQTAPIVIPVNIPGYMAMEAPTEYVEAAADYTDAGFIYVNAGCRGRDAGAPYGVTDLKAAVRYIRYNDGNVPGCTERIFTFGMSGGGAQSALMGATGDSELYTPYLEAIGAVEGDVDTTIVTLTFENGAIGVIDNSRRAVYGYDQRLEVFGSEGAVQDENDIPNTVVVSGADGTTYGTAYQVMWDRYTQAFIDEMKAFADAVIHDKVPPITDLDGLYPVLMAAAANKSLKEGRPVKISEVDV